MILTTSVIIEDEAYYPEGDLPQDPGALEDLLRDQADLLVDKFDSLIVNSRGATRGRSIKVTIDAWTDD